jgi:hypothetical protein
MKFTKTKRQNFTEIKLLSLIDFVLVVVRWNFYCRCLFYVYLEAMIFFCKLGLDTLLF